MPDDGPHVNGHSAAAPNRLSLVQIGFSVGAATVQMLTSQVVIERRPDGQSAPQVVQLRPLSRRAPARIPYLADGSLDVGSLGFAILEHGTHSPVLGRGVNGHMALLSGKAAEDGNAYWIGRALEDIDYSPYQLLRAGPNLEAVLAAYGSGAVARSLGPNGEALTVLNVDLGASTSKLALCRAGAVVETAVVEIGTRSVAFDEEGAIVELRPAAARAAAEIGVALGHPALTVGGQQALADKLGDCLFNVVERRPLEPLAKSLMLTRPLSGTGSLDLICFTGGGAEYVYERQDQDFHDLGALLGKGARQRLGRLGIALHEPERPMQASLVGLSEYWLEYVYDQSEIVEPPAFAAARERDLTLVPGG